MEKLMAVLAEFQKKQGQLPSKKEDEKVLELAELFKTIAKQLLYGGSFVVISPGESIRRVYPHTVEFYYHEETDGGLKDYIVYHRNKGDRLVQYFQIGSINAHQSGIDITFESEKGQYRASALIRAFRYEAEGEEIVDTRCTFLYDHLLTGLQMPITIQWEDSDSLSGEELKQGYRVNVSKYDTDGKPVNDQDCRPWAFSVGKFPEKLRYNPK